MRSLLTRRATALVVIATGITASLVNILLPTPGQATLPVIDVAAVGQLVQQGIQFSQHLVMMAQQIALLKQEVGSLSGNYGIGRMPGPVNGWGTSGWNDIVGMVASGFNPGDVSQVALYAAARTKYQTAFPVMDPALLPGSARLSAQYTATYQAAISGLGSGESTINGLSARLALLQTYQNKIDHTENVKAAMDLNTAVGIQIAEINAEILRTNAMHLYLTANGQNTTANGQAAQAEFFTN